MLAQLHPPVDPLMPSSATCGGVLLRTSQVEPGGLRQASIPLLLVFLNLFCEDFFFYFLFFKKKKKLYAEEHAFLPLSVFDVGFHVSSMVSLGISNISFYM